MAQARIHRALAGAGTCGGHGNITAGQGQGAGSPPEQSAHLFFRVGPVEAQEQVGVPAVQEQICCSEGDGEALDGVAEVGGDPEVRGKGIHEDVLGVRDTQGRGEDQSRAQAGSNESSHPRGAFGRANLEGKNLAVPATPLPHTPGVTKPYKKRLACVTSAPGTAQGVSSSL